MLLAVLDARTSSCGNFGELALSLFRLALRLGDAFLEVVLPSSQTESKENPGGVRTVQIRFFHRLRATHRREFFEPRDDGVVDEKFRSVDILPDDPFCEEEIQAVDSGEDFHEFGPGVEEELLEFLVFVARFPLAVEGPEVPDELDEFLEEFENALVIVIRVSGVGNVPRLARRIEEPEKLCEGDFVGDDARPRGRGSVASRPGYVREEIVVEESLGFPCDLPLYVPPSRNSVTVFAVVGCRVVHSAFPQARTRVVAVGDLKKVENGLVVPAVHAEDEVEEAEKNRSVRFLARHLFVPPRFPSLPTLERGRNRGVLQWINPPVRFLRRYVHRYLR